MCWNSFLSLFFLFKSFLFGSQVHYSHYNNPVVITYQSVLLDLLTLTEKNYGVYSTSLDYPHFSVLHVENV